MNGAAFFCFGAGRGGAGDIFFGAGRGRDQNSRGGAFSGRGMPGQGGGNNMSTLRSMSYSDSEFSPCNKCFFQLSFINHLIHSGTAFEGRLSHTCSIFQVRASLWRCRQGSHFCLGRGGAFIPALYTVGGWVGSSGFFFVWSASLSLNRLLLSQKDPHSYLSIDGNWTNHLKLPVSIRKRNVINQPNKFISFFNDCLCNCAA